MAKKKKRINIKLIVIITSIIAAVVVTIGGVYISKKYANPQSFFDKAQILSEEADVLEAALLEKTNAISDLKERHTALETGLKALGGPYKLRGEAIAELGDVFSLRSASFEQKLDSGLKQAKLALACQNYKFTLGVWNRLSQMFSDAPEPRRLLLDHYLVSGRHNARSSQLWDIVLEKAQALIETDDGDMNGHLGAIEAKINLINLGATEEEEVLSEEIKTGLALVASKEKMFRWYQLSGQYNNAKAKTADFEEDKQKFYKLAFEFYKEGIDKYALDVDAYETVWDEWYLPHCTRLIKAVSSASLLETDREKLLEEFQVLQKEIDALLTQAIEKMPNEGMLYFIKGKYQYVVFNSAHVGKAVKILSDDAYDNVIKSLEKSVELDDDKGLWLFVLAHAYHEKSELISDGSEYLYKSYQCLKSALYKRDLLLVEGHPKNSSAWGIRFGQLYFRLVHHAAALAETAENEIQKENFLETAEEITIILSEQFGDDLPSVQACNGFIAMAKGEFVDAETLLYRSFINSKSNPSPLTMYKLAQAINYNKNTELSLRFHDMVMNSRLIFRSSKYILEAINILSSSDLILVKRYLISLIDKSKSIFEFDEETKQHLLLLKAETLIFLHQYTELKEIVPKLLGDDVKVRFIKAMNLTDLEKRVTAVESLLKTNPAYVKALGFIRVYYKEKAKNGSRITEKLKGYFDKAVELAPNEMFIAYTHKLLLVPNWHSMTRKAEIELQIKVIKTLDEYDAKNKILGNLYEIIANFPESNDEEKHHALLEAKKYYELANNDPYANVVKNKLARICIALDDNQALEALIADAIGSKNIVLVNQLQAIRAEDDNEYAKAVEHLRIVVEERPLLIDTYILLAKALILDFQNEEAISMLNILLSSENNNIPLMANNVEANWMMAILLDQIYSEDDHEKIDYNEASEIIVCLNRVILGDIKNFHGLRLTVKYLPVMMMRTFEATRSATNLEHVNKIIENLFYRGHACGNALIEMNSNQGAFYAMLANVYTVYANLKDFENNRESEARRVAKAHSDAEEVFKKGLLKHPDNTSIGALYSQYLSDSDREKEAIKVMEIIANESSDDNRVNSLASLASAYSIQGAYLQAVKTLDEALVLEGDNLQLLIIKCETLGHLKKYSESIDVIRRVRALKDAPLYIAKEVELLLQSSLGKSPEVVKEIVAEARAIYQAETELHPDKAVLDLIGAKVMIFEHLFEEARILAKNVIDKTAVNVGAHQNAYILIAEAYNFEGNIKAAIETMETLRAIVGRESSKGLSELSRYYNVAGRPIDAMFQLKEMIRISPKDVGARLGLIKAHEASEDWEEVVSHYVILLKQYPKAATFHIRGAHAKSSQAQQLRDKKQISKSTKLFKEAIAWAGAARAIFVENNQSTGEADIVYLQIESMQEKYAQVLIHIDQLYPDGKFSIPVSLLRSVSLFHLGKKDEALDEFDKAIATAGDNIKVKDRIISYIQRVASTEDIIAWLNNEIIKNPKWLTLYKVLTTIYKKLGDSQMVVEVLKRTLENMDDESIRLNLHYELGLYTGSLGNYEASIKHYKEVLSKNNSHGMTLNNLAYTYMLVGGHKKEAEEMAAKAYALEEENADFIDTYVMTLIETKKFELAESLILKAIDIKRENKQFIDADKQYVSPEFYYHLGQVLEGLSENERARIQFEIAIKLIIKMKTKRKDYLDMKKDIELKLNV